MSAQFDTLVPGRRIFDNATVQMRWVGAIPGRLWASMAATGHSHGAPSENSLSLLALTG